MPCLTFIINNRLDVIADSDLPRGKVVWGFDKTDMKAAKEKLGDKFYIGGNVPTSLLATGTSKHMDRYWKELIEMAHREVAFLSNRELLWMWPNPRISGSILRAQRSMDDNASDGGGPGLRC